MSLKWDLTDERRVRCSFLIKYVSEVEPTVIDSFKNSAPDHVTEAMRHAIQSLLGSLPREFFEVTISTIGDNLRSLMYSFIMTGYLFRTVEYHLELQNGLESALPASVLETGSGELPDEERAAAGWRREDQGKFAEGVNKSRLSGEVTRWRHGLGPETVGAMEYVTALENEIERLKERVAEVRCASGNLRFFWDLLPCRFVSVCELLLSLTRAGVRELEAVSSTQSCTASGVAHCESAVAPR